MVPPALQVTNADRLLRPACSFACPPVEALFPRSPSRQHQSDGRHHLRILPSPLRCAQRDVSSSGNSTRNAVDNNSIVGGTSKGVLVRAALARSGQRQHQQQKKQRAQAGFATALLSTAEDDFVHQGRPTFSGNADQLSRRHGAAAHEEVARGGSHGLQLYPALSWDDDWRMTGTNRLHMAVSLLETHAAVNRAVALATAPAPAVSVHHPSSLSSFDSTATKCSTLSFSTSTHNSSSSSSSGSSSSSNRRRRSSSCSSGNTTGEHAMLHAIAAAAAAATAAATDALPHTVPHATTATTTATTTHHHPHHRVDSSRSHAPHHGPHESATVLGIDFGGTGIKGAPVDVVHGVLLHERVRIPTPVPATPAAVAGVIRQLQQEFLWDGPIGVGMPSVVRRGVVRSAANIDKTWIDVRAQEMFEAVTGCPVAVLNDADAAGHAEMRFGAGREFAQDGVVLMLTFGTGIGTALFVNGMLVPNLEMGHIEVDGEIAEKVASGAVREREEMSWKKWASRVNEYIERMEHYLQPDMIIIGGGVSKKDDKFMHLLHAPAGARVVRAEMRNEAGIVGAALGGASILNARWQAQERARVNPTLLN